MSARLYSVLFPFFFLPSPRGRLQLFQIPHIWPSQTFAYSVEVSIADAPGILGYSFVYLPCERDTSQTQKLGYLHLRTFDFWPFASTFSFFFSPV